VAPAAGRDARSPWRADSRRHQLSQAGTVLGRRGASVLRCTGEDRELSGGGDSGALDRGAGVGWSGRACICPKRG
jgi:hypothetical protein